MKHNKKASIRQQLAQLFQAPVLQTGNLNLRYSHDPSGLLLSQPLEKAQENGHVFFCRERINGLPLGYALHKALFLCIRT